MIEAAEALRVIGEAQAELAGPLLNPRYEDRVIFVGDTHGAIDVTQTVIDKFFDDADLIVFLGDYVDRGSKSLENLGLIASTLLEDPHRTIMLRGNHESPLTNPYYGFTNEVTEKLGEGSYEKFKEFFQAMPYAVVVNDYLCLHGGIAKGMEHVSEIASLPWPDLNPDDPIAFQLLWNDPRDRLRPKASTTSSYSTQAIQWQERNSNSPRREHRNTGAEYPPETKSHSSPSQTQSTHIPTPTSPLLCLESKQLE